MHKFACPISRCGACRFQNSFPRLGGVRACCLGACLCLFVCSKLLNQGMYHVECDFRSLQRIRMGFLNLVIICVVRYMTAFRWGPGSPCRCMKRFRAGTTFVKTSLSNLAGVSPSLKVSSCSRFASRSASVGGSLCSSPDMFVFFLMRSFFFPLKPHDFDVGAVDFESSVVVDEQNVQLSRTVYGAAKLQPDPTHALVILRVQAHDPNVLRR